MKIRFEGAVKLPKFHAFSTTPKTNKSTHCHQTKINPWNQWKNKSRNGS